MQDTVTYGYGNATWKDLLTGYDGRTISYDGIGNPTNDGIWSYAWKNGRQLASMSNGSATWSFTYDANGLRNQRTNGSTTYDYIYNGSQLAQMTVGGNTLRFTYDALGMPLTVTYNGTTYYYSTNVQGDIIAILDASGNSVVQYVYDAWGNVRTVAGTLASTLGAHNPLRYRSYVYDNETQLYYLQSRYYNPETARFLNADAFAATGQGLTSNNMFTYCLNNPANRQDIKGNVSEETVDDIIEENLEAIIAAAEEFGVDPAAIIACIFIEQTYNVDIFDSVDSLLWFIDTSIGIGQVKSSTAMMLEDKGYIEKTDATTSTFLWIEIRIPRQKNVARKLENPAYNIRYIAAYLKYHIDTWKPCADISQNIAVLATLYNVGYRKPHSNPQPGEFGIYFEQHKDKIYSYLD